VENDGIPTEAIGGVQAIGALGGGEEAFTDRPSKVTERPGDEVANPSKGLLLAIEGDDGMGADDRDDEGPQ